VVKLACFLTGVNILVILDLHSHSIKSDDGRAKVQNYCQWIRAKDIPIDGFVLTEHRQFDLESDYSTLAAEFGITILKGAEVETEYGQLRIDVGKGQLKGVSLLRTTFERLGAVGEAALLLGALRGGKTLQRFYEDEFESITGTFHLAGGRARTDDLRLVYRHYTADLRGSFGLILGTASAPPEPKSRRSIQSPDCALTRISAPGTFPWACRRI